MKYPPIPYHFFTYFRVFLPLILLLKISRLNFDDKLIFEKGFIKGMIFYENKSEQQDCFLEFKFYLGAS